MTISRTLLIALAGLSIMQSAIAQPTIQTPPDGSLGSLRADKPFKPTFLIKPLVHQLTSSRGKLVEFEFEITSNLESTNLEIAPVGMIQQENGVILPDVDAALTDRVQLLTPSRVDLRKGESHTAKCRLRVPAANTPFLMYGLLVKQLPPEIDASKAGDKPQVGIRFMTQYLLRADIVVKGVRGDTVKLLEMESGELVARNGNAVVTVYVENPSGTSMEFQMRTELVSRETKKSYKSKLYIPVRVNQAGAERYDARILKKTRLRMEGELPQAVFPGDYDMKVDLLYKGRVYKRAEFPVTIQSGDFPAQDATIVQVAKDIGVTPSQIQLSLRRGGSRLESITIENSSQQRVIASLKAKPLAGELCNWLNFRPETLELAPGQKRKVLITLGSKRDFPEHSYAYASIEVRPEVGRAIGTQDIPVCLLTDSESAPELKPSGLQWQPSPSGFLVPIENVGRQHVPLQARFTMKDEFGRGFVVNGGYGRWLLPGKADQLWFPFVQVPPPGNYNVTIHVDQGGGRSPMEMKQDIKIQAAKSNRVSEKSAEALRN